MKKLLPEIVAVTALVVAGTCSWLIIVPGETLVWPVVVDVLIFTSAAAAIAMMRQPLHCEQRRQRHVVLIGGLGLASVLWSCFGALPISVAFDSTAARAARHEIALFGPRLPSG